MNITLHTHYTPPCIRFEALEGLTRKSIEGDLSIYLGKDFMHDCARAKISRHMVITYKFRRKLSREYCLMVLLGLKDQSIVSYRVCALP